MKKRLFGMVSTAPSLEYTRTAIATFAATTPLHPGDTFLLVDNDGSLTGHDWVPPFCTTVGNRAPKGFAENFNALIDRAVELRADLYLLNNDLVFTDGWSEQLAVDTPAILSPLSNREVGYAHSVVVPQTGHVLELTMFPSQCSLEEYRGREAAFAAIVSAHRRACRGLHSVYVAPFFCAKVPLEILETLGYLDEHFGRGGGEDFDYCLRAHLAGFRVAFALGAYVLHFGGKSSWSGVETTAEQTSRETRFRNVFREKWGPALFELILRENNEVLMNTDDLAELDRAGKIPDVIRRMLGDCCPPLSIGSRPLPSA